MSIEERLDKLERKKRCEFKQYVAILSQEGTNPPVPIVLFDTIGISASDYSYVNVGTYKITKVGKFPLNKVVASIHFGGNIDESVYLLLGLAKHNYASELAGFGPDTILLSSGDTINGISNGVFANNEIYTSWLEIRVYP